MRFNPILSGAIGFHVGNPCSTSDNETKNVLVYRKQIFFEAYNCIKNLIVCFCYPKYPTFWSWLIILVGCYYSCAFIKTMYRQLFFPLVLFNLIFTQLYDCFDFNVIWYSLCQNRGVGRFWYDASAYKKGVKHPLCCSGVFNAGGGFMHLPTLLRRPIRRHKAALMYF